MSLKFILQNLEDLVASAFLIVTTVLVIINIIMRYILNSGLVWSEEVATGCFVWSVFIGAVAVFKHRGHVGVDLLVKRFPAVLQKAVRLITDLILVVLNGYMAYLSVLYIQTSYTKMTPVLGVSSAYISSSVLIAFVLMTIYAVKFVIGDLCGCEEVEK
ncbi:TRAP transporter small permease [uncultured Phascolarctobacterium sp.]|uniref:TRAP transporter small permease n=1 Tax=uncultured Phascolarctobacterium sp. TaxID=512296 RepID=UPI00260C7555|nr:TRAP transporter small permease [uncultured Phascolarctobacterium sp.]